MNTTQEAETRLSLPYPPSINRLYRSVGGRSILSEAYRKWRAQAEQCVIAISPRPKMKGPVRVEVDLSPPDKRRRDIDNAGFKAVLDLLVVMQVIEADDGRIVKEITGRWVESDEPCVVTVRRA